MRALVLLCFLLLLFSSCATTYVPTTLNVPTFSNKGEFQAKLLAGFNGGDVQLGYAATNHLGLMVNFSAADDSEEATQFKRNTLELGAGYYTNLNGRLVWEAMGGVGLGKLQGVFTSSGGDYFSDDVTYSKVFIQPAIGWTTDILDVSFATRVSIISMDPANAPEPIETIGFFEPALTLGLGFRWLKFHVQGGLSVPTVDPIPYTNTPFILNVGLAARIGKKFY
ncbi:MAG: outer membrane beta-barrel protein [Flavobacteriales bacterium]|nr:outer membrane beta-barrel protein [Flavobacteriales bacterium]